MKNGIYVKLGVVLVISFGITHFLPMEAFFKGIASLPGVGALIAAIYQILRDEAAHEKELRLQRQSQIFSLGATSHMANVAFDKHVQFCEKYLLEVHDVVILLFKEGPTLEVVRHIERFGQLQREYSAWIPRDMALQLAPFVDTLHELAAKKYLVNALKDSDDASRAKMAQDMFEAFRRALRLGEPGNGTDNNTAREQVKERVRAILGIEQLTFIRQELVVQAANSLKKES